MVELMGGWHGGYGNDLGGFSLARLLIWLAWDLAFL